MKASSLCVAGAALWAAAATAGVGAPASRPAAEKTNMVPFVLPWDDGAPGPTDLSGLSHAPAGKFGHLRVAANGHIYAGEQRVRFFGNNVDSGMHCPEKSDGEADAARLAKFGFNLIRWHHMDFRPFPVGLVRKDAVRSNDLDPCAVDRMDYYFAQLKKRGIYSNINLLTGRHFNAADGLPAEIGKMDWKDSHVPAFFHPRMIELQKDYARQLLGRRNPYTGLTYAEDPAVAFVEIINEHGLMNSYFDGRMDKLPEPFARELQRQWGGWLKARHGSDANLAAAWGEAGAKLADAGVLKRAERKERDRRRLKDWIAFLYQRERDYYADMNRFLKEELKVKALVMGTICQNSTPNIMGTLDAIDVHEYWNHPHFIGGVQDWWINDRGMIDGVLKKFGFMSLFRVEGKPFCVTEYNHCLPSPYASDGPLVLAAYASLQDWDAVYLFSYARDRAGGMRSIFGSTLSPAVMANAAVAAAVFRRGDVAAARELLLTHLPAEAEPELAARIGTAWAIANAGMVGARAADAMQRRLAIRIGGPRAAAVAPAVTTSPATTGGNGNGERIVSDTGQITLDQSVKGQAHMLVDAPRARLFVGYVTAGQTYKLGDVTFTPGRSELGWCTAALVMLDGEAIGKAGRALLVVTGSTQNTGMTWKRYEKDPGPDDQPKMTIADWGKAPALTELVPATITLPGAPGRVAVRALDGSGQRGAEVPVTPAGLNSIALTLPGEQKTIWYEVTWK